MAKTPVRNGQLAATFARPGFTQGTVLRCEVCQAEQPCPPEQIEAYDRHGWPKHCDETMQLCVTETRER